MKVNENIYYTSSFRTEFGRFITIFWERLETKRACRIKSEAPGNVLDKEQWDVMQALMVKSMLGLELTIKNSLKKLDFNL